MRSWLAVLNTTGYDQAGTWTYARIPAGGYGVADLDRLATRQGLAGGSLLELGPAATDPDAVAALELAASLNAGVIGSPPPVAPTLAERLAALEDALENGGGGGGVHPDAEAHAAAGLATTAALDLERQLRADVDVLLDGAVTELDGRVVALDGRVGTTEQALPPLADRVTDVEGDLPPLTARVAAAEAALPLKADLVGGVIPTSQLPAIAVGRTVPVESQAAMLALTALEVQPGDVAIRTDLAGRRFLLAADDPSTLGSWVALETPDAVTSVNGQAGPVVLGAADVGAAPASEVQARVDGDLALASDLDQLAATVGQLDTDLDQLSADVDAITPASLGAVASSTVTTLTRLTRAAYDLLNPKDAGTLYVIVG